MGIGLERTRHSAEAVADWVRPLGAGYQFLPLLVLGGLLGLLFVHTRNLLAPVLLHCVWNIWIFLQLATPLAASAL